MRQPLFQFVHASDPHWGEQTDPKFALAPQRSARFLADLQALTPPPRFLLVTGDLSSRGSSVGEEIDLALAQLGRLPFPVLTVPGNHDLAPDTQRGEAPAPPAPLADTPWYRRTGEAGLFWTALYPPLELVGFALRDGDPDGVLDRLAAHLARPAQGHRVLCGHYPAYPVRQAGVLARWGPDQVATALPRLRQLLAQHADTVVAYLFGHIHVLCADVVDGVLHASGGAIAVGAPGFRIFSVFADGLASRFVPLSDPALVEFAFWGSSRPEHATDPRHPTPGLYHSGLPEEQDFFFDFATRRLQPL